MGRKIAGRTARGRCALPLLLALVLCLAAGRTAAGRAEAGIRMLNASGNENISLSVDPIQRNEGFSAVLYNNRNGLPTSEANAIAMTGDGFLWIGSYAGLVRYDANNFERIDSSTGISNVRCLYTDSLDRLWIGTNDSGLFLMEKEKIRKWDKQDGLKSVSIRAISEDGNGRIYIAGTSGIATVDREMNLAVLDDERINDRTIRDVRRGNDGLIYGITEDGDLFTLRDGKIDFFLDRNTCRIQGILAILPDPEAPGYLYIGTSESRIYHGELARNFPIKGAKGIGSLINVERFEYIQGKLWICASNGIGRLESDGFHALRNVPMDHSIGHVLTDYEGNLWFTSTRQGVMKIVPNRFTDLFERYNLPENVVNTTCASGSRLMIGTDGGLILLENGKRADALPLSGSASPDGADAGITDLVKDLEGVRVRSIIPDSLGRIWISTWRKYGLICYDHGEATVFTEKEGLFSNQVRTVVELSDGSIAAANRGGVSIIRDGRVVDGYGEEDGIAVTDILTLAEGEGQELILGSDGGGIYIVSPEGTKHIGTEDGLSSDVILRIRRSAERDIYWIITSNSLAYMTPDHQVTTLRQFPYSNNYDLYENSRGDVWILSSNGIYVLSAEELLSGEPVAPVFYGIYSGLPYVATVNSYSGKAEDGTLYIASSQGVVTVNIEKNAESISSLKIALPYMEADDVRVYPDKTGVFRLPGGARRLTIYPYIFNYSLINPQVSYCLEGFDSSLTTVNRNELLPVVYTNLPNASYRFVVHVNDPVGRTNQSVTFRIEKGGEASTNMAGSVILDTTALVFLVFILGYSSVFRKRGRTDDRLLFAMAVANMVMALAELGSFLLENRMLPSMRELMYAGNTFYYAAAVLFPFLLFLYTDYHALGGRERSGRMLLLFGLPCLLLLLGGLAVNLRTGWIFSITPENTFRNGPANYAVLILIGFYLLLSLIRIFRINPRLVVLGLLIIGARVLLDLWYSGISSTAFTYALILISVHIYAICRPAASEEAA